MIDSEYLSKVLPVLKANGVRRIETQGLKVEFYVEPYDKDVSPRADNLKSEINSSVDAIAETIRKQEESLPPDLRADNLMNVDNIMNWSSPDQPHDQPEMPLTGEVPL